MITKSHSKARGPGGATAGAPRSPRTVRSSICPRCSGETTKTRTVLSDGTPIMHRVCVKCKIPIASVRGVARRIEDASNRKATKGS